MSTLHPIPDATPPRPNTPPPAADIIFIHGLGDDPFLAWRPHPDTPSSWPFWLAAAHPSIAVWSLGYAAAKSHWPRLIPTFVRSKRRANPADAGHAMPLPDRALDLLDLLTLHHLGQSPTRPLFFIAHSLGGLVTKHILRLASDSTNPRHQALFANTRAVLFLATPHQGSNLASFVGKLKFLFRSTVSISDLRAHHANLRELANWYRHHSAKIHTATYYEGRPVRGITIVNPTSAHPGIGVDPVQLDEDHFSIAKPRDPNARVYLAATEILLNHVKTTQTNQSPPAAPPEQQLALARLEGLRRNPPSTWWEDEVMKYHAVLTSLEQASGKDQSGFRVADSELHQKVQSLAPASFRTPGRKTGFRRRLCYDHTMRQKIDSLLKYLESLQPKT